MASNKMVEVRNDKTGLTTKIKESSWKNWGSAKAANNDVRHGYRLVRAFTVDDKGKEIASEPPVKAATFKPAYLPDPSKARLPDPATGGATTDPPIQPGEKTVFHAQPAQEQPPQGKPDHLAAIPALTNKIQEALHAAGLGTYKALAAADPEAIGKVLDGMAPPMTPKRAQIPAWQKAAGDFVKVAATPML